jgi:thiopurine S-methyltransferase
MDKAFWKERWQRREIGFHQPHVHEQLKRYWPSLNLPRGSTVFVPMAGKSRDMTWLATQGHRILGVELSDIAVREFFAEGGQPPERRSIDSFEISSAGPFSLYCGDFFDLSADALHDVAAVYDRAALVALPAALRDRYAEKLVQMLPRTAPIFLIALDYPENEISGPPFTVPRGEVERIFGDAFDITVLEARDGLADSPNLRKRGVTRLGETTYVLRRRA